MITVPVTVKPYKVNVSVVDNRAIVSITPTSIQVPVSINYGLNATQVDAAIDVKIAEIAIPTKTSELDNDSGFIGESALTKENIEGLTEVDSPEFADTEITSLATESTYTPAVWAYLVRLFTTVPKSVKSHLVKIWERIFLLEDKYVLKYVLPVDTNKIILTTDKYGNAFNFSEGDIISINYRLTKISPYSGGVAIIINSENFEQTFYYNYANALYNQFPTSYNTNTYIQVNGTTELSIIEKEIHCSTMSNVIYSDNTLNSSVYSGQTVGKIIDSVTKITFITYGTLIKGSSIIIKKK